MNIHEYQAKAVLKEFGAPVSRGIAIFTPDPAGAANPPLVYYIQTDHLNTPRVVFDKANRVRWLWLAEPFGTTAPENNPGSLGVFTQPLRFPGQYADQESGLFYNWNRYLDPQTGRYITSDPIGLAGGSFSTYAYVNGNPLAYADPFGLEPRKQWDPEKIKAAVTSVCGLSNREIYTNRLSRKRAILLFPTFAASSLLISSFTGKVLRNVD